MPQFHPLEPKIQDLLEHVFSFRMPGAIPTGRATEHGFRKKGGNSSDAPDFTGAAAVYQR
jgi:hypothetical protein